MQGVSRAGAKHQPRGMEYQNALETVLPSSYPTTARQDSVEGNVHVSSCVSVGRPSQRAKGRQTRTTAPPKKREAENGRKWENGKGALGKSLRENAA